MTGNAPAYMRMAFRHPDGLVPAWKAAAAFAGPGGRIATLPDVIDARLATPAGTAPWGMYFTTATGEYYGTTRGGVPVLAVAHGIGPLATLEGCVEAYSYALRDNGDRRKSGGRIPREAFHALLDGTYGEVAVVELLPFLARYEYPFGSLTLEQALEEPLVAARLGGRERAAAYLARHQAIDEAYAQELGPRRRQGRVAGIVCMAEDSNSHSYDIPVSKGRGFEHVPRRVEDGLAFAHLLAIGQLTNTQEASAARAHVQTEVSPHDWHDGARFAGWRANAAAGDIHQGVDVSKAVARCPDLLWRDHGGPVPALDVLVRVGEGWFTAYPKEGARLDTGLPMHRVLSMEPVGGAAAFETTEGGYGGWLKYDVSEVLAIAPEGADAYALEGDAESVEGTGMLRQGVRFYRVTADRTRRLATPEEVQSDAALVERIAAALDGGRRAA